MAGAPVRSICFSTMMEKPVAIRCSVRANQKKRKKLPLPDTSSFGHEWAILQNNHEQYERTSLLIKLGNIALFVACLALSLDVVVSLLLMLLMWMQEAVFRTSQSRLGLRIVRIEELLARDAPATTAPYQLHSEWLATRPGFTGLLGEYGRNMLRPTVAFPHVVLLGITVVWFVVG